MKINKTVISSCFSLFFLSPLQFCWELFCVPFDDGRLLAFRPFLALTTPRYLDSECYFGTEIFRVGMVFRHYWSLTHMYSWAYAQHSRHSLDICKCRSRLDTGLKRCFEISQMLTRYWQQTKYVPCHFSDRRKPRRIDLLRSKYDRWKGDKGKSVCVYRVHRSQEIWLRNRVQP